MSRPPATTFEYLQFHAASTPDRVALIMDDGEYTYGRFADDALRFTKALADLGIERLTADSRATRLVRFLKVTAPEHSDDPPSQ